MMRPIALTALLAATLLAGCAGNGPDGKSATDPTFDDLGLTATSSTGIIRGVVVDDAIRPIAGAKVVLSGGDSPSETVSTESGAFGFSNLVPGTYFLSVSKVGFFAAQQSADVVAGVEEPAIVKVLLQMDAANMPFVQSYVFSGFIECMTPNVALCGLVNDLGSEGGQGNLTQDNSQVRHPVSQVPTWVQSEMIWTSTQALGGGMSVMYSWDCDDTLLCDHEVSGTSPLLLTADAEAIDKIGIGTAMPDVYIRTFTAAAVDGLPINSAGLTIEQSFEIYTHVFYGYQPPEGWRFSSGEPVPTPPG